MNKLEKLQAAISTLPDQFVVVRNRLKFMLDAAAISTLPDQFVVVRNRLKFMHDAAAIGEMRTYSLGLYDVAVQLTLDEALMKPLREIREVLG